MCNELRDNDPSFKTIKKTGVGYKIVRRNGYKENPYYMSVFKLTSFNSIDIPNDWNDNYCLSEHYEKDVGFCFFTSKKEARKLFDDLNLAYHDDYRNAVIVKIAYKDGLGKRDERRCIIGRRYMTALCKEFTILEELS